MKHTKKVILAAAFAVASTNTASAVVLAEVSFAGTTGDAVTATIGSGNSQFTVKDPVINLTGSSTFLNTVGGGAGVGAWTYGGSNLGAFNNDVHTATGHGNPTRFDLGLGVATTGNSYSVEYAEVDVFRAARGGTFEFTYRDMVGGTVIAQSIAYASQTTGTATTYRITLSTALTATDLAQGWDTTGTGRLRFGFFEANGDPTTGADGLNIRSVRLGGTVVPEPSAALLGAIGSLMLLRRKRG